MRSTLRTVCLFRLGSCGVFDEEAALLAEGQLVELCKCKFLWYEEYCLYQGTCPDWVYWSSLFFLPTFVLFYTVQGTLGPATKSAQHVHMGWGRPVCVSQDSPPSCQAKNGFCPMFCSCADHFLQRRSLARSLWCCPRVLLCVERT